MITLADFGTQRRQATLSNGTRVVVFERPGMPAYLRACFLSGSRFDQEGKEGTAHFLEHMLVAGTKRFPSKDKLAAYIEQLGGIFGAVTSLDTISINTGIGDPADLDKAIEVLHEILFESIFDEKALETERGSVLSELRDRLANPGVMVWDVAKRLIFQGTDLAKSTMGSAQTIGAITRDDITKFYHDYITADRMILVASGGVTLEQVVAGAEARLLLPKSPTSPTDFSRPLPIKRSRSIDIESFAGKEQIHLVLGFRTAPAHDPDIFALDIIAEVLGGGRASVLSRELRYQRGLVYGANAYQTDFADAGTWAVKTSTSKDKLQDVLDGITAAVRRVADTGLTPEELQFAKEKITKSKRMELQTSVSWVNFHARQQLLSAEPWTLVDYLQGISAVTADDVRRVAQKYFKSDGWYLALCGDVTEDSVKVNL